MLGGRAGIYGGAPAPLRAHPAGGLCEPRRLFAAAPPIAPREIAVRMAPRIEARPYPPAVAHGSSSCLACRWGGWLLGGIAFAWLTAWQPIPDIPINIPVNPDLWTWLVALHWALFSGVLFGIVPARQVMNSDPWQIIRSGASGIDGYAPVLTLRDLLLVGQKIAIARCW